MTLSPRIRRAALAAAATLSVAGVATAAIVTPGADPRARLALDVDAPLFAAHNAANLLPGESRTACMSIGNDGDAPGRAALYLPGLTGELAPYLTLTVTRGKRSASASTSSCAAFVADRAQFGSSTPGLVYRGRLSDFPQTLASALLDPEQWAPGDRHAYRFTITVADDPAAAGLSARWNWRLAVDSLGVPRTASASAQSASSSAASTCSSVQIAGTGIGRGRALTKTVRINRRVRAVLILRTYGAGAARRVVVTTGLRVRNGKTLVLPGWARVRYRLNGSRAITARTRPFRSRLRAATFLPGRNRVSVAVQRPHSASKRLAAFRLNVTETTIAGRSVCVLSA